jgi:hypothetical protein
LRRETNPQSCAGPTRLAAWPPLLATGTPTGVGVSGTLGTIDTPDGKHQVTLNGWPFTIGPRTPNRVTSRARTWGRCGSSSTRPVARSTPAPPADPPADARRDVLHPGRRPASTEHLGESQTSTWLADGLMQRSHSHARVQVRDSGRTSGDEGPWPVMHPPHPGHVSGVMPPDPLPRLRVAG